MMLEREMGRSSTERALGDVSQWNDVRESYALLMAGDDRDGEERSTGRTEGQRKRGALTERQMLRAKVRYFVDGMVIGSKDFVDDVFRLTKDWFGEERRSGARRINGVETPLRTLRALRVRPLG